MAIGPIVAIIFWQGASEIRSSRALSVAPILSAIPTDRKIGKRRIGLLCARAGDLHWSDVALDSTNSAIAVARRLHQTNTDVVVPNGVWPDGLPEPTRYRLTGTIVALDLSACTTKAGIARLLAPQRIKGVVSIKIRWRLYERSSETPIQQIDAEVASPFERSPTSYRVLVDDAILANLETAKDSLRPPQ